MSTRPYDPEGRPGGAGIVTEMQRILRSARMPEMFLNDSIPRAKVKGLSTAVVTALPTQPPALADGTEVILENSSGAQTRYRWDADPGTWVPVRGAVHLFAVGWDRGTIDGAWHEIRPGVGHIYNGFNPQVLRDGGFTQTRVLTSVYLTSGGAANFNMSLGFNEVFGSTVAWGGGAPTYSVFSGHAFFDTGWFNIASFFLTANYFLQPMYLCNLAGAMPTIGFQSYSIEVR